MNSILILNASVINEGQIIKQDVFVKNGFIERIGKGFSHLFADTIIDATDLYLMPGIIDDQVHFREPGLTHKADIHTESKAAVAGGTTSFMEMPNTVPNTLTQGLLQDKYDIAAKSSYANYSFFMGASNDNYDEVMKTNAQNVCGIKIFMGSSTGNMLVDNQLVLKKLFANVPMLIATHCEDEATVKQNLAFFKEKYGESLPHDIHAIIRNEAACYESSSMAVALAEKLNTRLHILHISSAEEIELFRNKKSAKITSEVCVHHLWFTADDYKTLGNQIKCNPAIKNASHAPALLQALKDDIFDIVATDHAPHTWDEKSKTYWDAPSGLPLVQHSLNVMLEFYHRGEISLEKIVQKMTHSVADCFKIDRRGYIREGYHADLVLFDLNQTTTVSKSNLYSKCQWSPFEGKTFHSKIKTTIVSGGIVFNDDTINEQLVGQRLLFKEA
jgi:dihydroorotase